VAVSAPTFTRWTRISLAGQVLVLLVLGFAAVLLVIEVAQWPTVRLRVDLTATRTSSLDERTVALLEALPERAEVDVFHRVPADFPDGYAALLDRVRALLRLCESEVPDALSVRLHDANDLARAQARMDELRVAAADIAIPTPVGTWIGAVVVSVGERRTILRFVSDLGHVDLGDPRRGVRSSLSHWRGEEALCEALGRVSGERSPRVLLAQGHGEAELVPGTSGGLLDFVRALELDGFEFAVWDGARDGAVPTGTDLLVLAGQAQPYVGAAREALDAYVAGGGRVLAALGEEALVGAGGLPDWLSESGVRVANGLVCLPRFDTLAGDFVDGDPRCTDVELGPEQFNPTHPSTAALAASGYRTVIPRTRALVRGEAPAGGTLAELVFSPEEAWVDLPSGADGAYDLRRDRQREPAGRQVLAMASEWVGLSGKRSKVVVLGSTHPLTTAHAYNEALVEAAVEWLVDRDFRVRIPPKSPYTAVLERSQPAIVSAVGTSATFGFPLVCVAFGIGLALRRRR
jgi:hypothetical protein